jgi:hypothetical protein
LVQRGIISITLYGIKTGVEDILELVKEQLGTALIDAEAIEIRLSELDEDAVSPETVAALHRLHEMFLGNIDTLSDVLHNIR